MCRPICVYAGHICNKVSFYLQFPLISCVLQTWNKHWLTELAANKLDKLFDIAFFFFFNLGQTDYDNVECWMLAYDLKPSLPGNSILVILKYAWQTWSLPAFRSAQSGQGISYLQIRFYI